MNKDTIRRKQDNEVNAQDFEPDKIYTLENLENVVTYTPCKITIDYKRYNEYKSFYLMEFFYRNTTFMEDFLRKVKIYKEIPSNNPKTVTYDATGENNILYVFQKNRTNAKPIRVAENKQICYVTKSLNDKIIKNTRLIERYKLYFLDLMFNENNKEREMAEKNGLFYQTENIIMMPNIILKYVTDTIVKPLKEFKMSRMKKVSEEDKSRFEEYKTKIDERDEKLKKYREGHPGRYNTIPRNVRSRIIRDRYGKKSGKKQVIRRTSSRKVWRSKRQTGGNIEEFLKDIIFEVMILPDNPICEQLYRQIKNIIDQQERRVRISIDHEVINGAVSQLDTIHERENDGIQRKLRHIKNYLSKLKENIGSDNPNYIKNRLMEVLFYFMSLEPYVSLNHLTTDNVKKLENIRNDIVNFYVERFEVLPENIKIDVEDIHTRNNWIGIKASYRNIYKGEYEFVRLTQGVRLLSLNDVIEKLKMSVPREGKSVFDNWIYRFLPPSTVRRYRLSVGSFKETVKGTIKRTDNNCDEFIGQSIKRHPYVDLKSRNQIKDLHPILSRGENEHYVLDLGKFEIMKVFKNISLGHTSLCGISVCVKDNNNNNYVINIIPNTYAYLQTLFTGGNKRLVQRYLFSDNRFMINKIGNYDTNIVLYNRPDLKYKIEIVELVCFDCSAKKIVGCDDSFTKSNSQYNEYLAKTIRGIKKLYYVVLMEDHIGAIRYNNKLKENYIFNISLLVYNVIYAFYQFIVRQKVKLKAYYDSLVNFLDRLLSVEVKYNHNDFFKLFGEIRNNPTSIENNKKVILFKEKPFICLPSQKINNKYTIWFMFLEVSDVHEFEIISNNVISILERSEHKTINDIMVKYRDMEEILVSQYKRLTIMFGNNDYLFNAYSLFIPGKNNSTIVFHRYKYLLDIFIENTKKKIKYF